MKLITKDTDYAVRALCYMAKHNDDIVSVDELVKYLLVPRQFIRKILQILNKKRILKSFKGKGGGFVLNTEPKKISLLKLLEIFQGPLRLSDHRFKKNLCHEHVKR